MKIDAVKPSTNDDSPRANKEKPSSHFADLLSEQVVKVTEVEKSKQPSASNDAVKPTESTETTNPRRELATLLAMGPLELIRYQMLHQMGLTEEALQALPPEERTRIEEIIKEQIEQQLNGGKDGGKVAVDNIL